jgi:hypothetical protein
MEEIMSFIIFLWITIGIVALIWVFSDATERYGDHLGCIWTLLVIALGPLAIIAYLIIRNFEE